MRTIVKAFGEKLKGISFYSLLMVSFIVVGATDASAAWDLNTADSKVRTALGTILFIIAAVMAIKAYAKGRKGTAIAEILVGSFLGIFVASADSMKGISEFFKGMFGF